MFEVVGDVEGTGSVIEIDPWLPLKITWEPRPSGRPVYIRVSGDQGGEIEFKVDPSTGQLIQMIVIDMPPAGSYYRQHSRANVTCRVPIIGSLPQVLCNRADIKSVELSGNVIFVSYRLESSRVDDLILVKFGQVDADRYLICGDVQIGISSRNKIVEISALLNGAPIANSSINQ